MYLVMSCGVPIGETGWIADAALEAVGPEGSEHY